MAKHLYGAHDRGDWQGILTGAGKTGWVTMTFGIGDNPNDQSGYDFTGLGPSITPIARLNYSHHGEGTIPLPDRYDEFAARCANFVFHSKGCKHWIIGNEPNLKGERPQGVVITPGNYAHCFGLVRRSIKGVSGEHGVITAGIAPYNVDTGDWIKYSADALGGVGQGGGADGIGLHAYSRGGDPNSIFSEAKMDAPYQEYYNGFRVYRDFLATVPPGMRALPAYITETDQNVPWVDANSGWVVNAYKEINNWNLSPGTQKIYCLCLYRWDKHDQWEFQTKNGVINDLRNAVQSTDYRVVASDAGEQVFLPVVGGGTSPKAVVSVPSGANLRSGPGVSYSVLTAVPEGTVLTVTGKNAAGDWWQVENPAGGKAWVSGSVVATQNVRDVPVVPFTTPQPPPVKPSPDTINKEWMIGAWSRVLGIDETVARAILAIESGGRSFEAGRMIIRFENHIFVDCIGKMYPDLVNAVNARFRFGSPRHTGHAVLFPDRNDWESQHDGGQAEEWKVFLFARTIAPECAMRAISMGSGQVMGGNYGLVGYPNVGAMFNDFNNPTTGEFNQLTGFFAYLVNKQGMLAAVKAKDWRKVATLYNGSGNEDVYEPLLRNKYRELGGKD